jgi:hypothetical protein
VGAEVARVTRHSFAPTFDAFPQRPIDVLKRFGRREIAGFAEPLKNAARDDGLLCFVAQKSVFQRDLVVRRLQPQRFGELIAASVSPVLSSV